MLYPGATKRIRMLKIIPVILFFLFTVTRGFSQEVVIKCEEEPLNKILINLRDTYGIMLSFDDKQLSSYKITVDKKFSSPAQAIDHLIRGLPLKYEVSQGVYIFNTVQVKEKPKKYVIAGRITDRTNYETLPFSAVFINKTGLISDAKGNFAYTSTNDSIFSLRISYLGYYILDTIVAIGSDYNFMLTPSVIELEQIIVEGSTISRSIQTGNSPGISRLNHKIAYYLPGNGDNSIFNLLRLQPGILAAGEQSADFIIWGSYEGQSQVIFDGFTLYGLKNFNDNINAVNPYMAKDIKVLKGGYGAEYGERVGGIVDITGMEGNRLSPSAQFTINNMTLNGKVSVPFGKKSALLLAYRQTYYNLYDSSQQYSTSQQLSSSGFGSGWQSGGGGVAYYVRPVYNFRDANLKYSGNGKKSNYFLSLYGGMDNFSYAFDYETQRKKVALNYNEKNFQLGGSAFYGLNWSDKNTGSLTVSFSSLLSDRDYKSVTERTAGNQSSDNITERNKTLINELNIRAENKFTLSEKHIVDAGAGMIYYYTAIQEGTTDISTLNENSNQTLPYLYMQDNITLFKKLTIRPGIRTDYHSVSNKVFFQPRLSVMYRINDYFRANAATGIYNQFVAKNMTIDTSGNYRLAWSLCDNSAIPVLNSNGYSLGFSFNKNGFTASIEGYLKNTNGITRYIETGGSTVSYEGDGKTKGLDFFVKKDFKNQTLWVSYTLSKTEEHFPYFPTDGYLPALHDQRHELKLAGMAKVRAFHFSVNYVFGSGFPDPAQLPEVVEYMQPYSRLDAAIIYQFLKRKIHIDAGISVLNILNKENIRYANITRVPSDDTNMLNLYTGALLRTPAVFLNIYY